MTKSPKLPPNWVNKLGLVFAVSIGILLYFRLGRDALFDWDEGIYAELGRTLLQTRNLFITFWNHAPWLEKPPGIAWVTAIGIAIAGPSSFGARLLMPLFAAYTLYIVYRIGCRLGGWKQGLIAASILATLNLFLGRTRAVNTDMPLLASITTTILLLLENKSPWAVAIAIFGGVWFKGLAGLLSVVIALPLFLTKSKPYFLKSLLYLLALCVPWHLYAYSRFGDDFTNPYFFEQVIRRATTQIEFHFENRWYYFRYLYDNLGLGLLLVSGVGAFTTFLRRKRMYLLWWVLAPLAIFTLAKTRLFWYILPVYPALALLASEAINYWGQSRVARHVLAILALGFWAQALLLTSRSVEISKISAPLPDRLKIAHELGRLRAGTLAVLVPPSERLSEALLPAVARLSSSFRYGGMPSVVFYYQDQVKYYYDVDAFRSVWDDSTTNLAMVSVEDLPLLTDNYQIIATTPTYVGLQKGVYALR